MYIQKEFSTNKICTNIFSMVSWSITAGSQSKSGSINRRHWSADPDPPQNLMDPKQCLIHFASQCKKHTQTRSKNFTFTIFTHRMKDEPNGIWKKNKPTSMLLLVRLKFVPDQHRHQVTGHLPCLIHVWPVNKTCINQHKTVKTNFHLKTSTKNAETNDDTNWV